MYHDQRIGMDEQPISSEHLITVVVYERGNERLDSLDIDQKRASVG